MNLLDMNLARLISVDFLIVTLFFCFPGISSSETDIFSNTAEQFTERLGKKKDLSSSKPKMRGPVDVVLDLPTDFQSFVDERYDILTTKCQKTATLIQFNNNSSTITQNGKKILNELAKALKNTLDSAVLLIAGHTDIIGTHPHNLWLSNQRAVSVKHYLVDQGIDDSRLYIKGYGPDHPIDSNESVEGRAHNRRSEFFRIGSL